MTIRNPKLPQKPVGQTTATLSDGKVNYNFLIDPETIEWSYQADYAITSVLLTDAQDITWKSSIKSFSIPRVLYASQGMTKDVSSIIKQLDDWCSQGVTLKFSYGGVNIPRCHITRCSHKDTQWRSGKVTQSEGRLDFIISREPPKVVIVETKAPQFPTTTPQEVRGRASIPKSTTRTNRELVSVQQKLTEAFKNINNREKAARLRDIAPDTDKPWDVFIADLEGKEYVAVRSSKSKDSGVSYYTIEELKGLGLL